MLVVGVISDGFSVTGEELCESVKSTGREDEILDEVESVDCDDNDDAVPTVVLATSFPKFSKYNNFSVSEQHP